MIMIYTDLALESTLYKEQDKKINVINKDLSCTTINKGEGNRYITYLCTANLLSDHNVREELAVYMSKSLKELLNLGKKKVKALVIGLGNRGMTADALGPKVVDKIIINKETRHTLYAFTPSVSGLTGLETFDIVKGICDRIKPDTVIAIDTLASRRVNRISSAYQMSDSGIRPGSGVGNNRKAINRETLDIPVIAIGVPLVVYAKTLARDVLSDYIENAERLNLSRKALEVLGRALNYNPSDLVVTPKEIDNIVEAASDIISLAINYAFDKINCKK